MSDSVRPHRRQPTRLPHPWDSPGKNTGVGCHFLLQCMKVKSESEVTQSCLTLSDPMDYSSPGPLSMGFSRQEYWSGVPLPSPRQKKEQSNNIAFMGEERLFSTKGLRNMKGTVERLGQREFYWPLWNVCKMNTRQKIERLFPESHSKATYTSMSLEQR